MMHYLESTIALLSQRVLADGNDLFVLQKFFSFGEDVSQIIGHQKWGSHDSPQGHLSLLLIVAQAKVSYDQLDASNASIFTVFNLPLFM